MGEDEDELSFEKGEIIQVIPYEDPDDEVRVCACCGWEHYITSGPVFVIQMTRCVCVHVVAGNIILHQGQYL